MERTRRQGQITFDMIPFLQRKFHTQYYDSEIIEKTFWHGVKVKKNIFDLWIYQEILFKTKPDILIETGTFHGGATLFFANIMDMMNHGKVISIDNKRYENKLPVHKKIHYIEGNCIDNKIIQQIKDRIEPHFKVMAILDSVHNKSHVLKELNIYSKIVTKGNYLIVEDTNINGNPVNIDVNSSPMQAIEQFLKYNNNYIIDREKEKFLFTFNPCGFLKRI